MLLSARIGHVVAGMLVILGCALHGLFVWAQPEKGGSDLQHFATHDQIYLKPQRNILSQHKSSSNSFAAIVEEHGNHGAQKANQEKSSDAGKGKEELQKKSKEKMQNATDNAILSETKDFKFDYEPFIGRMPLFLNKAEQKLWEGGHKELLAADQACASFLPRKQANEIRFCNPKAADGHWTDILTIRKDAIVPVQSCEGIGFQKDSPPPSGDASTDLLGYDSWSFQHFLDGPALRIAQNGAVYHDYKATLLADIREGTGSYNNPLVPRMIHKAGFGERLQAHCGGWNTREPCVSQIKPELSLGCSAPPFVPKLAMRFRQMMGVSEDLPRTGGFLVFAPHRGRQANNPGRNFVNLDEVQSAVQSMATQFGLDFHMIDTAITESVESATSFWGQVKLLVGAHGGAMYNTWFMPQKAGVIEIQGNDGAGKSYFWDKVVRFDQAYAPLYSTMSGGSSAWNADMIVNVDGLKALMEKVWAEVPHEPIT